MKRINMYFFGSEELEVDDFFWFYGYIAISAIVIVFLLWSKLV